MALLLERGVGGLLHSIAHSGTDVDFQGWVMKGHAASTLSLDHLLLEPRAAVWAV